MHLAMVGRLRPLRRFEFVDERLDVLRSLNRPFLWIEATYVKVRQNGCIVSVAVIVAVGVNGDGRRELLGLDIGPTEADTFRTGFLRKLARRCLRGVKLVISDAHEVIKATVSPSAELPSGSAAACTSCAQRAGPFRPARAARGLRLHRHRFAKDDAKAARAQWLRVSGVLRSLA